MRIIFAGTPDFAQIQLKALLEAHLDIVAVYTQPDRPAGRGRQLHVSPVKALAQMHNLPLEQPVSLKNEEAVERLTSYQPDVLVVAAYGLILPEKVLAIPTNGCINVHASLLPRWRGASPIQQAILAGDKETGITLMRMDKGLDTGNILAQASCLITDEETAGSLHDKLAVLGANLLKEKLAQVCLQAGTPQDPHLATHCGKLTKEQGHIDWHLSAQKITQQVRAFNPWPICYSYIDGQLLRIWQAKPIAAAHQTKPGTIMELLPEGPVVAAGEDAVLLLQGQLPGKKCLSFAEICRGHASLFAVGQQLI